MQATGVGAGGRMKENVRKENKEKDKVQRMNSYWTLPLLFKTAWGLASFLEGAFLVSNPLDSDSMITNHLTAIYRVRHCPCSRNADFRVCWHNKYWHQFRSRIKAFIVFLLLYLCPCILQSQQVWAVSESDWKPQKAKSAQSTLLRKQGKENPRKESEMRGLFENN